eukprot:362822-Chlamydomonas_euryale.AAC.29
MNKLASVCCVDSPAGERAVQPTGVFGCRSKPVRVASTRPGTGVCHSTCRVQKSGWGCVARWSDKCVYGVKEQARPSVSVLQPLGLVQLVCR